MSAIRQETWGGRSILFILLHIPLGILAFQRSPVLTYHAWAVLGGGLFWVLFSRRMHPVTVLYWAGYIAGAEVLWRLARAHVFWEFGKYATMAVIGAYLLRRVATRQPLPQWSLPLVYLAFLLPSAIFTIKESPVVREDLSFNLSGPLSLALCAWVFAQLQANRKHLYRIAVFVVAPTVSIASAALYSTWMNRELLTFTRESNPLTSGGFGPNQVSAALGLGMIFTFILVVLTRSVRLRLFFLFLAFWLLFQAFLTFSRGGVLNALLSLALIGSQYIRAPRYRGAIVASVVALFLAGNLILIPWLDTFTAGAFRARFTELDLTNRGKIMAADVALFREHPLMGVGPGMAKYSRQEIIMVASAAHTEFTRLLAEHGLLGVLALLFLFRMSSHAFAQARTSLARGLILAILGWSLVEMFHSAMRIVAISYLFGLSQVQWSLEEEAREAASFTRRQLPFRRRVLAGRL